MAMLTDCDQFVMLTGPRESGTAQTRLRLEGASGEVWRRAAGAHSRLPAIQLSWLTGYGDSVTNGGVRPRVSS
jgi:hypothetical protein